MTEERNIFGAIRKNKWMAAFIATAIALVIAIVVAVVIGIMSSRPEPKPEYFEGDEAGIYYYDVADGEILLTLSGGNRFTLAGPQINKTGTYTIDADGNIVLDYVRDEDGTENAKLTGNTITLQKGDASMPFLKKVNYTVTFNVDGGSDVKAATVVNGKTVAKPSDPTKSGYAFLGWYSDSALKNSFDFSSTIVTESITLYARWVHDEVGVGKYTINFDLGSYDGAPEYGDMKTIAGLAYNVPTPEREGYIFGGWWISMYEDGEKLSYEYTESTVFNADTTLYAVWYQETAEKLPAPMASINKNTIKWNSVSGAVSYDVTITDPAGNEVYNESVGTTTINFNFEDKNPGDYVISVVAVAQDAAKNSDATVRYVANKALTKVSQFQVVDGILIYNAVDGATAYYVTVECGNPAHKHTDFDNGMSTSFSLMNCPMQESGIKITVTAKANGYASSVSETFVYNRVLDAVDEVVYNAQVDAFVWNAVPAATSYTVTITVGDKTYTVDNGLKTSFPVAGYTGEITVAVKPVNSGYNSPAATTATCSKVSPATPSNVTVNGMIVSWDAADGAESYMIKIGDNAPIAVNGTSYDLSAAELTAGQTYAVSVMSVKGAESSAYTEAITFGYKVMSSTLTYKNNTVYWTPVIGVNSYEVKVNGTVVKTVNGVCYAEIELTREGANLIEVRYTDVAGSAWASTEVIAYSISLYPKNDTNSVFTKYYAIGDTITLPADIVYDGYDFVDWYTSPTGAAGNGRLYKTGDIFNDHGSIALFADWSPKTYGVTVEISPEYGISNITDKTVFDATYTKDFTLPIPELTNAESLVFAGWFTGPGGTGEQLTDETGASVNPYGLKRGTPAYPYFRIILSYVLQPDNTYAVKRGPDFDSATHVVIPTTYMGIPVTTVLENAFSSRRNLVKISIPDTIELVGVGALSGCSSLEYIDIYKVEGTHEIHYASDNGALIHYDGETVYLEVVPRKMKGDNGVYEMSDEIQYIATRTFQYTDLDKVVIGKNVINVAMYAFYQAHMTEVEFAEGRTEAVHLEDVAFYDCRYITSIKLPSALTFDTQNITTLLDSIKTLKTITVDPASKDYNSVKISADSENQVLTNKERTELIYVPLTVEGDFTVPAGIRSIKDSTFINRTGITSITIPSFVTKIGDKAFAGCSSVNTVEFLGNRNSNLEIGSQAFAGLTALKSVTFKGNSDGTLEAGSIKIGANAFTPSTSGDLFTSLTFENGVNISEIGSNAFANREKLAQFKYGDNTVIGKIGANAFQNNSALVNLVIPKTVTEIGSGAFADCANIVTVTILEGEHEIKLGENAFQDCENLRSITLPKTVTNFNSSAFAGCRNLKTITIDDANPYLFSDENGILYNEEKTVLLFYPKALIRENNGKVENILSTVVELDASVFEANTDLKSIKLPAGVTTIGKNAFSGCTALETVIFEGGENAASTLTLGDSAFKGCTKLVYGTGITLPEYTEKIGNNAFSGCTAITELTIPTGVTTIGDYAFKSTKIKSLVIPTNVTSIGAGAFQSCTSLTTVTVTAADGAANLLLGSKTASVGAFQGCTALANVDLGNRVTLLGNATFSGCSKAGISINIGSKVTYIGDNAFKSVKITSITIPSSVTKIGASAFESATLTSIFIPKSVTEIGSNAFKGTTLESIEFEMGGTEKLSIGTGAFANQAKITSIKFPARLNSIYTKSTTSNLEYLDVDARFTGMTKLAKIEVEVLDGYTAKFSAKDGVLYENENGVPATLIYNPVDNAGVNGTVTIPKTVTYVARGTFYSTTKITKIVFEEYAEGDANYGKPLLYIGNVSDKITSAPSSTNTKYTVFGGATTNTITEIHFPSHLAGLGSIAVGATKSNITITFGECTDVTIAPYALTKAKFVTIDIPGVSKIGKGAFVSCTVATDINFTTTDAMTEIPADLFKSCSKLVSYTVPKSVIKIGGSAFNGCAKLATVTFEAGSKLKEIGSSAFSKTALKSIDLSVCKNLESIGIVSNGGVGTADSTSVFLGCAQLESVNLSGLENLKAITASAFEGCTALKSFTLPATVEYLGSNILTDCASLTEVTLYGNFTPKMFENNKFVGCTSLKTVKFENSTYFVTDEFGVVYDTAKTVLYRFFEGADPTGYTIPETIKTIEKYAFANYAADSIVLPEGIETIGDYAFICNKFTALHIPASVISIGNDVNGAYEYKHDPLLETVTFAKGSQIKSIGEYTFYYAAKLKSIELPDSLETMGKLSFANCSALTEITIPASLKEIPYRAFYLCTALKKVVLQDMATEGVGLEIIGTEAFAFASSTAKSNEADYGVVTIEVPSSVTTIGSSAFDYNPYIGNITFTANSKLTTLGINTYLSNGTQGYTFRGTKIKDITLPPLLENLYPNVFLTPANSKNGPSSLETITFTGGLFKSIPNNFFQSAVNLKSVTFAEGLETIGQNAFSNGTYAVKSQFKSVNIPASVTSIGANAFYNCPALETVIFAEGSQLTEIPTNAFAETPALTTVKLPSGLVTIGDGAFENSGVDAVVFSDTLTEIGEYAFSNTDIAEIDLPASLKKIGNYAFNNCDNIVNVELFGNIEYLGDYAFYDCDKLETATPSSGLMYFGGLAFAFCEKLTEAYIPDTVNELGGNPYAGCTGVTTFTLDPDNSFYYADPETGILFDLEQTTIIYYPASITAKEAIIPDTVTSIGPGAFAGAAFESIEFAARFKTIPANAFRGCANLLTITIPDGITEIGDSAFQDCVKLNGIVIPNSVGYVGNYAFSGCTSLSDVSFTDKTGTAYYTLGTHIFDGCTSLTTMVLPNAWLITEEDAADCGIQGPGTFGRPGPATEAELKANIPSYMFANTGITEAHLPANVTMLCTKGVFMNCASLTTVTFGATSLTHAASALGADYFTGCTSLPANFKPPYKTGGGGGFKPPRL